MWHSPAENTSPAAFAFPFKPTSDFLKLPFRISVDKDVKCTGVSDNNSSVSATKKYAAIRMFAYFLRTLTQTTKKLWNLTTTINGECRSRFNSWFNARFSIVVVCRRFKACETVAHNYSRRKFTKKNVLKKKKRIAHKDLLFLFF